MKPQKRLARSNATYLPTGDQVSGYEIHIGDTTGLDCDRAWLSLDGRGEGAASPDGRVMGCYLHGLFTADKFRTAFFAQSGMSVSKYDYAAGVESTLDALASHIETHLDVEQLIAMAD
jgi:adenosylcobyric acid synthase